MTSNKQLVFQYNKERDCRKKLQNDLIELKGIFGCENMQIIAHCLAYRFNDLKYSGLYNITAFTIHPHAYSHTLSQEIFVFFAGFVRRVAPARLVWKYN